MTPEERKAYNRGQWAGRKNAWPDHRPPAPPDELAAAIHTAAMALRDEVDAVIATWSEDDEIGVRLAERVDAFDDAMKRLSLWLKEMPE